MNKTVGKVLDESGLLKEARKWKVVESSGVGKVEDVCNVTKLPCAKCCMCCEHRAMEKGVENVFV